MNRSVDLNIADFEYLLPEGSIAKYPVHPRDRSKLLLYKSGDISHTSFANLTNALPAGCNLVFNNTKVIHARLLFQKSSGARIEIFCLSPVEPASYEEAFNKNSKTTWHCLIGNQKKWKTGALQKKILIKENHLCLHAELVNPDNQLVKFSWEDDSVSFSEILEEAGIIPIPPYLNRESEDSDILDYQTVYSKSEGSVAAPTAGLHFTPGLLNGLESKGFHRTLLSLHVGAGTFRPVLTESVDRHRMHAEFFAISAGHLNKLIQNNESVVAVGTTSLRTLESLYWLGCKVHQGLISGPAEMHLDQWEPYSLKSDLTLNESLKSLAGFASKRGLKSLEATTKIMIVPGYEFRVVKGLLTNYHLPKSTLLLLIAAFIGDDWKTVYSYALKNQFRFLSYGDSSLLLP